ncbi:MAG: polyketide cyclase [Deltaproteobacteria bacterium]|jgi:hypothetical protein|nr:polyketide cyclase [Deltaproteobacteria bacterium]
MELQCTVAVNAAKEKIWPYWADVAKRHVWEEDLESFVLDGETTTGTVGRMKLKGLPEMPFVLEEIVENVSYAERFEVPGQGNLFFRHEILERDGKTFIRHAVRLDKDLFTEEDAGFLAGVFADFPASVLKIKTEAEAEK